MTDRNLYVCSISSDAQTRGQAQANQRTAQQGILNSDTGAVESIATEPGEQRLVLEYRSTYAEKMAAELDELANASAIDEVPFYAIGTTTPSDGYYTISNASTGRTDPRASEMTSFDGRLTHKGTRASYRRAVETNVSQVDHPLGNDQTAYVGVPATASKVQWFDRSQGTDTPTLVETRSAELGDVEIYDADAAPFDNPTIVYAIDYADEGPTDVRLWDERGVGDKLDAEGVLQWQKVFVSSHDYTGEAILDNGLVRLRFDETAPSLSVERWDDAGGAWTSQSLGASSWSFADLDVREVGLASAHAVVEFTDGTNSVDVDCWVKRGWEDPLWGERSEAIPAGLVDLLSPVASASDYEPGESKGLVDRGEL